MKFPFPSLTPLGAAALGLGLALTPVLAQDTPRSNNRNAPSEGLRRLLDGFGSGLDDAQREQLNRALEDFQKSLDQDPGQPRRFQWEWRSDGQTPRSENESPRRRGRVESTPAEPDQPRQQNPRGQQQQQQRPERRQAADPADQMRRQMEQMFPGLDLERFLGDDFFGPLMREMQRLQGEPGQNQNDASEAPWFQGQTRERARSGRYEKAARRAMAEFRPVVRQARDSVVTLYGANGEQLSLATIITPNGYALTKASVLGDDATFEAESSDGRVITAKKIDSLDRYDLALLKLDADNLKPIEWNTTENLPVGTLLAASSPDEDPLAIGVVSVPARSLDSSRKGFLGVGMDGGDSGVKVTRISDKSAAEKAGLKVDDTITAIDGKPVRSPKELTDIITRKHAEDEVHISFRRGNEDKVAVATLQSRDDMEVARLVNGQSINESEFKRLQRENDPTARMGGRGNSVADGFPVALQNDLLINPNEVGGPVVDIDGKAVALNIARAERTKTYAIPAYALTKLLVNVQDGKLTEPKDISSLKRDARKAVEDLDQIRAQLKEAEDKARAAQEALEKQTR